MSFFSGLAQGFAQAYATTSQIQNNKKFKDLQVKKLKTELDLAEQQAMARAQLNEQFASGKTISDILRDPGSQSLILQSGLANISSLFKESRLSRQQQFSENLLKSLGGQFGAQLPGEEVTQPVDAIPMDAGFEALGQPALQPGQPALQPGQPTTGQTRAQPDFAVDPLSLAVAAASGDITQLSPPQMVQTTLQFPAGKMVVEFPAGRPDQQRIVGPAPEQNLSVEQAGRLSALANASDIVLDFKNRYVSDDGDLKLSQLDIANIAFGTPGTIGRRERNRLNDAIDAIIKARTGAGAGSGEQETYEKIFLPSAGDNAATVLDKINRIEQFANRTLDLAILPPSIRGKIGRFESKLQNKQQKTQTKPLSKQEKSRKEKLREEMGI